MDRVTVVKATNSLRRDFRVDQVRPTRSLGLGVLPLTSPMTGATSRSPLYKRGTDWTVIRTVLYFRNQIN